MSKNHHLGQSETIEQIPLACADEMAAVEFFERQRWGDCPCCVHCGSVNVYTIKDRKTGERRADGRWRCRDCGKQYTVRVGQIMEESPIPLRKWAYVFWCAATAKNGVSALEISRKIQITYKSALFMMNRIRWAMRETNPPKLSGTVEADETYVGGKQRNRVYRDSGLKMRRMENKTPVFAVVQRGGDVRAQVMPTVKGRNVRAALKDLVEKDSDLMTDESHLYHRIGRAHFASHGTVKHSSREYVDSTNPNIHTNTVEGFFSRIERSLDGTYHAVSPEHLFRYVDHAAYLYNGRKMNDGERLADLIKSADGKRLMYKESTRRAG
ncbi:MAG: IS1595 family transposase [Planctomycetes bacterium]|nr:IS1595 family transposase [Planctomycetota bacterium]